MQWVIRICVAATVFACELALLALFNPSSDAIRGIGGTAVMWTLTLGIAIALGLWLTRRTPPTKARRKIALLIPAGLALHLIFMLVAADPGDYIEHMWYPPSRYFGQYLIATLLSLIGISGSYLYESTVGRVKAWVDQ